MEIAFYQLLIASIIIISSFWGKKILGVVIFVAVIWTTSHIFMPWLMFLQFFVIFLSACIALPVAAVKEKLTKKNKTHIQL